MAEKKIPVYSIQEDGGQFVIMRDDKALETPRNAPVKVPYRVLAQALVTEAKAHGDRLDLRQMPMTQMVLTVIDIARNHRQEVITGIMRHGETELVCQRAAEPAELVALQNAIWQPFLEWCTREYGAVFVPGTGILSLTQPPASLDKVRAHVEGLDDFRLIGLSECVGISGSLVLGLALADGFAAASSILAAAELDALWQGKNWGDDPVTTARHQSIMRDLTDCETWFALLKN